MIRPSLIAAAGALALAGCRDKAPAPVPPPPVAPAPPPPAAPQRSDVACAAPLDAPGAREKLRAASGQLRIGALAGLKDAEEGNVAHIRRIVAELKRRGPDLLVADRDLGDNRDEPATR